MLIFGWNFTTKKRFGVLFRRECNLCHRTTNWELCKQTTWITLFFIPVIPYGIDYCLVCSHCDGYISLSEVKFNDYKILIETTTLEERERQNEIMLDDNSSNQILFALVPPDGNQEPIYCKETKTTKIKHIIEEYGKKWETPLAEDFCEIRYFLAKYDGALFVELHPELEEQEMTLEDYGIENQQKIYIIKEHTYSKSFLIRFSVENQAEKEIYTVEIFDEESNYINSFEADWYMWQKLNENETEELHLYLLDRNGIFLIVSENFEIN